MEYLDFLARLHGAVEPETYLEIGLRNGDSLALAGCPALGVDPAFNVKVELGDNVTLLRETSDEYFGRDKPLKPLSGKRVDMAFIDGMHLSEFALRDFIGVERLSRWTGVVIFDDILPRTIEEANRDRRTRAWTGDV
jgi:predicted O-methyltransferase YrrM